MGFEFEGIFEQHMVIKGRNRDTSWYGMLDRDWPAIKENMETWLYRNASGEISLTELNHSVSSAGSA